eukprot:CAMPEP_0184493392 /NCGR_PEP_ID=MMETSP0113_2-20130426/25885_1 /TAXON_ID=91329 /ORGANISM="Norrisiella sphaerica, Strain BC52" /LENGTH=397 /DNA_ID=CAMNT_0026878637 /DNA_START=87 /DNA_END=1280 /DNA_ORIENTATION=-
MNALAVEDTLRTIQISLKEVERNHSVALYLEDFLQKVASTFESEQLRLKNQECTQWNTKLANAQADWMVHEPTLFNATLQSDVETKRIQKENQELKLEVDRITIQVQSLKEEEDRLLAREDQKKAKKDVSQLPLHILRNIVSHLKCDEFVGTLHVCRRWRYYFDQAFLWKVFMGRVEKKLLAEQKAREAEIEKSMVPEPEEFKIECNQIKRGLQKAEIFQECLKAQGEEMNDLKSKKEDIENKIRAKAQVHLFLENKLNGLRDTLGKLRIEMAEWDKRARDSALENKELAKRMQDSDIKMKQELAQKHLIIESTGRTLSQFDTKINVLREIHSEIDQGRDKDAQNSTLKELLAKKKGQKKILKNTVKSLKDVLENLIKETAMLQKIKSVTSRPTSKS